MPDQPVGYFSPGQAKRVWNAVQWLERSGFMTGKGFKPQFNPPPERPIYVKNLAGEKIPMFGCVQATGTTMLNDQCFLNVEKPKDNTGEAGPFFLNLFADIPEADNPAANEYQYGLVTAGPHANALSPDLDAGTRLRPVVDSFELEQGSGQFVMIGPNDGAHMPEKANRVMVDNGNVHIVQFVLQSCSNGNASVTEVLCGHGRPVPGETNGCITVVDTMGCLTFVDGLVGWAAWVTTGTGSSGCYWSVFSLCCPD